MRPSANRCSAALALTVLCGAAVAADYSITMYTDVTGSGRHIDDFVVSHGRISIDDSAVAPDAYIAWLSPAMSQVEIEVLGGAAPRHISLQNDIFPPLSNPNSTTPIEQGLRLDGNGQPLRIDIPDAFSCVGCPPIMDVEVDHPVYTSAYLEFRDYDTYNRIFDANGVLTRQTAGPRPPEPWILLGGEWLYESSSERLRGYYSLQAMPVPEPSTTALWASAVGLMCALRLRKSRLKS